MSNSSLFRLDHRISNLYNSGSHIRVQSVYSQQLPISMSDYIKLKHKYILRENALVSYSGCIF